MEVLITSILTFTATNIDDLFTLTFFYSNKRFSGREIITGQLLGIGMLIFISLVTSLIGLVIPVPYIGLLGLFPIYLGIKAMLNHHNQKEASESTLAADKVRNARSNVVAVAGVTFANGGDNIAIYVPLFTTLSWLHKSTMVGVFLIMTLMWCFLARYLTSRPLVSKTIDRYGHWITPFVLLLLGAYILYESGSIGLVWNN